MVQVRSVRQDIPTAQQPAWAGALSGLGNAIQLRQAEEQRKEQQLQQLIPVMAQMNMLSPATAGEEGAIDVGGGQFVKFTPKTLDEQALLARERRMTLEEKRSPEGRSEAAKLEWEDENAMIPESEKKQTMRANFYQAVDNLYQSGGEGTVGPEQTHYTLAEWNAKPDKAKEQVIRQDANGVVTIPKGDAPFSPVTVGALGVGGLTGASLAAKKGSQTLMKKAIEHAGGYGPAVEKVLTKGAPGIRAQYISSKLPWLAGAMPKLGQLGAIARPTMGAGIPTLKALATGGGLSGGAAATAGAATAPLWLQILAVEAARRGGDWVGKKLYDESSARGQYGGFNPIGQGGGLEQLMANMMLMGKGKAARQDLNQAYDSGIYNQTPGL